MKARKTQSSFRNEKDAAEAFQSSKQALHWFRFYRVRRSYSQGSRRFDLGGTQESCSFQHQLPGFIAFVGSVHRQWEFGRQRPQIPKQLSALRSIVGFSGRQAKIIAVRAFAATR